MDQAKAAQKEWAKVPLWKRAEALHRFAKVLRDQKDPIAKCLVNEVGKCLKDAVVEVLHLTNETNIIIFLIDSNSGQTKAVRNLLKTAWRFRVQSVHL